jgi:hypothetical protein
VADLLRQDARLADPAHAVRELEALLQDEVQAREVIAVVDVVVRAVVVERRRAAEAEAIEEQPRPALSLVGRRLGGRGRRLVRARGLRVSGD